ncbi:MAG: EF-P lysine aminoacylase GenX, partial [bacterium]|nr:EF-P lysine aminoacylase GenX [Candidatus Colisoma equi]
LAAGMDRIYQIGPCFREGEKGSRHNPEFTMLEWYRRGANYLDIMEDMKRLFIGLVQVQGSRFKVQGGEDMDFELSTLNFELLRVREAYARYAGWDPWVGDWDQDRFDFDMATKIEPAIKEMGGGVFLMDYPPQAASLAKLSKPSKHPNLSNFSYAERWEFYWDGLELANCFTELCDRDEQLRRFEAAKESRKLLKETNYPIDYEFIESLPQMGSAAGVALGIDRLVMILTKTKEISAVRANI